MQRSSAHALCALVLAMLVVAYFPSLITPDALAQTTTLPYPNLVSITSVELPQFTQAQTISTVAQTEAAPAPKVTKAVKSVAVSTVATSETSSGEQLAIPSIGLNDPIVPVGVDSTGAMAVPSGSTNEVGWYEGGTAPGDVGSAVLDAHVFAAFAKLDQVKTGDDIYVNDNGKSLHFVVTGVKTFALSQITSNDLFVQTTARDLNLITCAGNLTPDHSTYDHRLVIYTTLVG